MADGPGVSAEVVSPGKKSTLVQSPVQKIPEKGMPGPEDRDAIYSQQDRVVLNAGHTDAIMQRLPGLIEFGSLHEVAGYNGSRQTILSMAHEPLANYLKENSDSQPHAPCEVFTLVCEEMKQTIDPNKSLQYVINDINTLNDLRESGAGHEEIAEAEEFAMESRAMLNHSLSSIPNQLIAINGLFGNQNMQEAIGTYIRTHGSTLREVDGAQTSQTYAEYLTGQLEKIKGFIAIQSEQMQTVLPKLSTIPQENFGDSSELRA